jgi:hypothetical protein
VLASVGRQDYLTEADEIPTQAFFGNFVEHAHCSDAAHTRGRFCALLRKVANRLLSWRRKPVPFGPLSDFLTERPDLGDYGLLAAVDLRRLYLSPWWCIAFANDRWCRFGQGVDSIGHQACGYEVPKL